MYALLSRWCVSVMTGSLAAAVAKLVHESGKRQMADIRAITLHEYQRGNVSAADYAAVFGDAVDPASIKKYWEYR